MTGPVTGLVTGPVTGLDTGPAVLAALLAGLAVALVVPRRRARLPSRLPDHGLTLEPGPGRATAATRAGRPDRRHRVVLVAGGAGLGALALVGLPWGAVVGPVLAVLAGLVAARTEPASLRRRRERVRADLPHVVDLLAAVLTVGLAPETALARVCAAVDGPVVEELDRVRHRLALGVDPLVAWSELGRHPQLGPLGRCVARSVDGGASVADAMGRLAEDLRLDLRAEVESRARSVGVKAAVPLGVCLLPAFVLVGVTPLVAGLLPVLVGR